MKPWFHRYWGPTRRGYGVRFVPANAKGIAWLVFTIVGCVVAFWMPTDNPMQINGGEFEGNALASALSLMFGFVVAYIFSESAPAEKHENNNA